jgi:[acyl-carrier-protein] S-malonyltransferase
MVFPGQGAQYIGMGKDLAHQYSSAREVFVQADEALGYKISSICFDGPQDNLDRTEITQPAILTTSIAVWSILKTEGLMPKIAAGLSLGEYTALVAAGALDFPAAVKLVAERGRIMQSAVPEGQGMMAAVMGLDAESLESICKQAQDLGYVSIANYNCPGQLVISGQSEAVRKACDLVKAKGTRVVPLAVSVPSHCMLMAEAAKKLRHELETVKWNPLDFPVVSNVTARETAGENIAELLIQQLYSPVKWQQSVEYMSPMVDYFVEVGPGKALTGFIKKIAKHQAMGNIEDSESFNKFLTNIKEQS